MAECSCICASLLERERAGLLEEPGRQPDLSDVVDEPAEIGVSLDVLGQSHALSDVP